MKAFERRLAITQQLFLSVLKTTTKPSQNHHGASMQLYDSLPKVIRLAYGQAHGGSGKLMLELVQAHREGKPERYMLKLIQGHNAVSDLRRKGETTRELTFDDL